MDRHRETAGEEFAPPFEVCPDGSVVFFLGDHCVQTAAKNAHRELTATLLAEDGPDRESGAAVDLLAAFLAGTDFSGLRAARPELSGNVRCRVRVFRDETGAARWEIVRPS